MPILVILFLTATCLPVEWPEPLVEPVGILTAAFVLLTLLASSCLSAWVSRNASHPQVSTVYFRWRRRLFIFNILGTAVCIGLGWGWTIQSQMVISQTDTSLLMAPFAELLIPGPYLLLVVANWFVYYPAEKALHRTHSDSREPFWSLAAFVLFQARQFALMILLPVMLFTGQRAVSQYAPETANEWWYQLGSFGVVVLLFLFLPRLARPLLGLKRLPPGLHRQRLVATAQRLRFRAELYLWPTRNAVANAMILGMIAPARFVVFTDRILEMLPADELDAVFGHEIGHAHHGHLPYYAGFFVLSTTCSALMLTAVTTLVFGPQWELPGGWGPLALLGLLASYLFVVFGFLSRVCERQADIDGARAVSCCDADCTLHFDETNLHDGRGPVCGTGARTMARALERVVLSGGGDSANRNAWQRIGDWVKAWQHGPARNRIEFLYRVAEKPELADRHDRFAFWVRCGLIVLLLTGAVTSGFIIGWKTVLTML